ncbi:hypothetical protein B0H13DRAFT_2410444, partial [Mycena leptocephala]
CLRPHQTCCCACVFPSPRVKPRLTKSFTLKFSTSLLILRRRPPHCKITHSSKVYSEHGSRFYVDGITYQTQGALCLVLLLLIPRANEPRMSGAGDIRYGHSSSSLYLLHLPAVRVRIHAAGARSGMRFSLSRPRSGLLLVAVKMKTRRMAGASSSSCSTAVWRTECGLVDTRSRTGGKRRERDWAPRGPAIDERACRERARRGLCDADKDPSGCV